MKNLHKNIGIFASSLFVTAGAVYLYSPVIGTHADTTGTADVNLNVSEVMSLTLDKNALNLNTTPNSFVSGSITATTSTNSQYGYTLTLEDVDSSSDMTHTNTSIDSKLISDFSGSKTSSELETNTWGFSLNTTDFYKVPVNGSPVALKRTTTPMTTENESTDITFGAKVGNITSGTYTDKVLFTVYVNGQDGEPTDVDPTDPGEVGCVGIYCIETMQEMTPAVCNENTTPLASATALDWDGSHNGDRNYVPRTVLTDTRDNNTYLVSKLADGNCWMSQNLGLDLVAGTPVEISYNDGTVGTVTPTNTTYTTGGIDWGEAGLDWHSYHPTAEETYFRGGKTKSSSPSGSGHEYDWEKVGNYYNWYAATGATGVSTMTEENGDEDAVASICPKGWRLPSNTGPKSFENLVNTAYGLTTNSDDTQNSAIIADPLNFTLSGFYNTYYLYLRMMDQGNWALVWSSSPGDSVRSAYGLSYNNYSDFSVWSHGSSQKGYGSNIRCVAI